MNFTITVSADQVNAIFAGLNKIEHGLARGPFDHILQQVQQQEAAAQPKPKVLTEADALADLNGQPRPDYNAGLSD